MLQQTEENSTIHHRSANAVTLLVNALTGEKRVKRRGREKETPIRGYSSVVLGFKGVYFITAAVVFTTRREADAAHPHGPLLDATAHIITLPEVLRATLFGGVVILLSLHLHFSFALKLHVCCSILPCVSHRSSLILI